MIDHTKYNISWREPSGSLFYAMIPLRQVIPVIYKAVLDYWKNLDIRSASDLDKHLDNFRMLFAYHSGRIENSEITYHDTREIFENGRALHFTSYCQVWCMELSGAPVG